MFILLLASLLIVNNCCFGKDVYNEELFIKQLASAHIYSLFQFTNSWDVNIFDENIPSHFNLFPKSFAEIVSSFGIAELHLSLTQGRWRYNKWGYPIINAPTGVELWVWFHPDLNKTSVDQKWQGLVHALSGQFCSSLNFINKAVSSSPTLSFKPLGLWPSKTPDSETHLRYATLSRETVCTENLTPWKKLLPCGGQAGLASLLDAHRLYDSSYHSLAVHLRSVCMDDSCASSKLELKQTISSVFDPVHYNIKNGWSLQKLFGRKLNLPCPVASVSSLIIDLNTMNIDQLSLPPNKVLLKKENVNIVVYDLFSKDSNQFDIGTSSGLLPTNAEKPYVLSHKYTTGYGAEMGGSTCIITNTHPTKDVTVSYLDIIPYFVRVYLHTLTLKVKNVVIKPEHLRFTPAYKRERPATIEFMITIPAQSTASISIEFEKVFLDWMQHPPDAHHGFYMGPSVISGIFPDPQNSIGVSEQCSLLSRLDVCSTGTDSNTHVFRRIYTGPLLIRVPLPDFSMPYNVICLTCTVIAIAFGTVYNLTTRTFQVEAEEETIKEKIKMFFGKFMKKEKVS